MALINTIRVMLFRNNELGIHLVIFLYGRIHSCFRNFQQFTEPPVALHGVREKLSIGREAIPPRTSPLILLWYELDTTPIKT